MKHSKLFFVIYDSILNSVFVSQVLTPLIAIKNQNSSIDIEIISFEQNTKRAYTYARSLHIPITLTILKRLPFLGTTSLLPAAYYLRCLLNTALSYDIIARGPLAGFICTHAVNPSLCTSLTVQARGLLAQEYLFTHAQKNIFRSLRAYQYHHLEELIYGTYAQYPQKFSFTIEAVSIALKKYLIQTFNTPSHSISIAQHDIPLTINDCDKKKWKDTIRTELGIPQDAYVYCYNGSAKSWQGTQEVVSYFAAQAQGNHNAYLLILSQDYHEFTKLLASYTQHKKRHLILQVPHEDIYKYLCAADAGLLFRSPHIVNWVSRPTKALEYHAAGLDIIHNNTVHYLTPDIDAAH